MELSELLAAGLIRDVPDFPQPGILFKDITPVLANAAAFQEIIDSLVSAAQTLAPDVIAGIESRGFLFGTPVALALSLGFIPIRKAGKLPYKVLSEEYALEYGTNVIEIHRDAVQPGQRVLVIDDLLATGGTAQAAAKLIERLGGKVVGFQFPLELAFLAGRERLAGYAVQSLITY